MMLKDLSRAVRRSTLYFPLTVALCGNWAEADDQSGGDGGWGNGGDRSEHIHGIFWVQSDCRGLREREESGRFVRELLAKI